MKTCRDRSQLLSTRRLMLRCHAVLYSQSVFVVCISYLLAWNGQGGRKGCPHCRDLTVVHRNTSVRVNATKASSSVPLYEQKFITST